MMRILPILGAGLLTISTITAAHAEGRETLGIGRVFTNDVIGDGEDRWRTGAYQVSAFRGQPWTGELPTRFGQVIEYRFRGEVISPANIEDPIEGDRLFAGTWWIGAHTHFAWQGLEVTAGADLAITGEQTGLRGVQEGIHDFFNFTDPDLEEFQVDNGVFVHGTVEVARDLAFSSGAIRPFIELQAGVEEILRAGVDITLGGFGQGGLRMRDPITGQRIAAVVGEDGGFSALLGGDFAYIGGSEFFPSNGPDLEDTRARLRAGVNYGFGQSNLFYGVTYLSEEFENQPFGQVVGSLSLNLRF